MTETSESSPFKRAARSLLFLNEPAARQYIPFRPAESGIPRIIHQTYRDLESLPAGIRDSIATLRERNPGWDYRFYDDAAMVRFVRDEYGPGVLSYLERIDRRYGAARADLFRYLLMYRFGGVYLDIKSSASRPFDDVLKPDDLLILSQWPRTGRFEGAGQHDWEFAGKIEGGEFQQWHIICAPGHPYIYAVIQAVMRNIDHYIPRMHGSGRNAVLRLTGPIAYTLAILPLLGSGRHRLVPGHEALGLDYSVYATNTDHKQLFGTHYTALTVPIVRANLFRRGLSLLFGIFERLRGRRASAAGERS